MQWLKNRIRAIRLMRAFKLLESEGFKVVRIEQVGNTEYIIDAAGTRYRLKRS